MKHSGKSRGHMQPRKQSQRRPVTLVKPLVSGRDQTHPKASKTK